MRYAIVEKGVVVNVAEAKAPLASNWIETTSAGPGWLYDGATFLPPPLEPIPTPVSVTARQARLALDAAGLLDAIETALQGQPRTVQLEWEYATVIQRDNATLAAVAAGLGITDTQMEDLFRLAATL